MFQPELRRALEQLGKSKHFFAVLNFDSPEKSREYTEKTVVQETKLEKLRRLNRQVTSAATMIALILGVVGVLIFGGGMSLVLVKGIWIWGVLLGAVGAMVFGVAYPVYRWVFNRNKKKYGAEILQLSEELLRGDE